MRHEQTQAYRDQFEYLADCFEWIRKRGDAFNIQSEALESERMVTYNERHGFASDRNQLLDIYRDIEAEAHRRKTQIQIRKLESLRAGKRFNFDRFVEQHDLSEEESQILLVLIHNESLGPNNARFTTGNEILNLLFSSPIEALQASRCLDGGATLIAKGLVRSISDDADTNFLRAAYEVTEKTLHEILGVEDGTKIQAHRDESRVACKTPDSSYRVIVPQVSLDQVVLPAAVHKGIEEVLWQAREGNTLYKEWGLDQVIEKGKGTIVLFCGPPGTGKTMTAEAMAQSLGKQLFIADYAQLESKWIGETEKNIVSTFRDAVAADAVLLLDEADAILSSRLDGGHYNDRAYNRQVSVLLTELEAFEGFCILTTNRVVTLDEGLARRVSASFTFSVPGPRERLQIWRNLLPGSVPLADDINLEVLARRFPMAGGHIKNTILTAVRKAALRDGRNARISQEDFGEAAAVERKSFRPGPRPIGFGENPTAPLYT